MALFALETREWSAPRPVARLLGTANQQHLTAWITTLGAALAFLMRWTQDDAYISLRYARNLATGHGLVYNPGEFVEGYTNFAWTVLMAVPLKLGIDPVLFGHLVSIAFMVATILALITLATRVFGSPLMGNLCGLVLLGNATFLWYGTGGLETQMQTALVTMVWLLALPVLRRSGKPPTAATLALLSALAGLSLLTRLDSVLVVLIPMLAVFWDVCRQPDTRLIRLPALFGPALAMVLPWTLWRLSTYGSLIPNTATAKANPLSISVLQGLSFLALFVTVNLLFVFLPSALRYGGQLLARAPFGAIAGTIALWVAYILKVGGDFMEFRFMVCVLPLLSVVLVALMSLTRSPRYQSVLLASLAVGFVLHVAVMGTGGVLNIDSTGNLDAFVTDPDSGLAALGVEINEALKGSPEAEQPGSGSAVIATGGAGAIPYYAQLRNVDPFGLTDVWTAEHGTVVMEGRIPKQGHSRMTTFEHLDQEGVNILIGTRGKPRPDGYDLDDLRFIFRGADPDIENLRSDATMIEIPMNDGRVYPAVYLREHRDIENAVQTGRWNEVPLRR